MIVTLYCENCKQTNEDNEIESEPMVPFGSLYLNDFKDQSQMYGCPTCYNSVMVIINTTK